MITKDYDHTTIKAWVEKHSGVPALVAETINEKDDGFLRIHFPNHNESDGEESTFYKFINRE